MLDLGWIALLSAWSAGVGLAALRRFGPPPEHPADALALAVPTGLGLLAVAALGLGEVGRLDAVGLGLLLAVGGAVGLAELRWWVGRGRGDRPAVAATSPAGRPDLAIGLMAAAAALGALLVALSPVTDGDALCYHLQVAKRFLTDRGVFYDPDLHETVYPLLNEMLYAAALSFRGPVACRLVEWVFGLAFAANVAALARPFLGRRAWWAGAIALLVPAVSNGMGAPLNDVALACFGAAALHAWTRFDRSPTVKAAALTGLLTGLAMGVKYPALVLAGLIGLAVAWRQIRPERGRAGLARRLGPVAAFAALAWVVGGGWYLRAWVHTGNPVHPFFRATFGGAGLDEVLGAEKRPLPLDAWHLLTAVGPLTLRPDTFDSFSHQFGPVFLLFLPAFLWERPPRRLAVLAGLGYAFLTLCMTQRQGMRFVLTAVGPLSAAVAWLAARWWDRGSRPSRALVVLLLAALGFESALAVARARHGLGVVFGLESPGRYLERREPTYRVGRWVGANLPASARLVGQDHRGFYIPRDYTMELAHRRRTGLGRGGESASAVVDRLRAVGFTHVLFCPPVPETAVEFDPALGRLLAPWLAGREPLYREDLADADGVVRHYAIYSLADTSAVAFASSQTTKGARR